MAVWQPEFTAFFTRKQQQIQQTSIAIRSKKMVVADREIVSVLGNNWVNMCFPNLRAMGCGCDRAFEQIWIDSAVRELAESRRFPHGGGFPSSQLSAAFAGALGAGGYVNRATRLLGDGFALVQDMANVLKQTNTEILAASIKSPSQVVKTLLAGAHQKTLPFDVLQAMTVHELSPQTVDEFAKNGRRI